MAKEHPFPESESEPKHPDFRFSSSTEPRRGQTINQDAVLVIPDKRIAAVFDGMGGTKGADLAASTASNAFHRSTLDNGNDAEVPAHALERLASHIENAHQAVRDHQRLVPEHENMGTTAAVVQISRNPDGTRELLVANVGDSRVYVLHGDGTLERITLPVHDDKKMQESIRNELAIYDNALSDADLGNHYMARYLFHSRHELSTYLGAEELRIDRFRKTLEVDDTVVLMTDGIPNNLTTGEIATILNGGGTSEERTSALIAAAKDRALVNKTFRSHDDDMSVVIIDKE